MLSSRQDPLFISKSRHIYFRHDVNISQRDGDQVSGFVSAGIQSNLRL